MASAFNNVKSRNIGTVPTIIGGYTVPAATQVTAIGLTVANTSLSVIKASVSIFDGTDDYYIVKNVDIAVGQTQVLIGGDQKVALNVGESIRAVSDTASSLDCILSKLVIN